MEITEEYLSRFPKALRACLNDEKKKNQFIIELRFDYDDIKVYRGIQYVDRIVDTDFFGNAERAMSLHGRMPSNYRNIKSNGVSVNEDIKELIKTTKLPSKRTQLEGIAVGYMRSKFGPADFVNKSKHHNWYLFEDCRVNSVLGFHIIPKEKWEKEQK